jgi:amino acid adenylation domain-containing protein
MKTLTQTFQPIPEQLLDLRAFCPDATALKSGSRELSYQELNHRADQFAGYLAQLGVVCGGTVAICMGRSFGWIVAALGIMRAGAAYVPLDPAWPDSRLRFALNDCGASALVAWEPLLDRLQVGAHGIDPCRDAAAIAAAPTPPAVHLEPESLAYVIYTSGSTGVPKGVEITHANLCHLIRWHRDAFAVTPRDHASHLAGLGFDAAVWELWPNLSAGATVCLADETVRLSPQLMQEWIIRERVTIAFVPTIYAGPLLAMEWPTTTPLRLMLTGGDVLHHAPPAQLPFEVVNNYGPSECTVVATSTAVRPGSPETPPIGRPITGTTIYLLNEHGERVPDGTRGEIFIGGNGVGRGYRNLSDSTERSFLPDPFADSAGTRMYRTGDVGIRRPDGNIEFHGRRDRQAKIRGQRVELDEIGAILSIHPSLDLAVAVTRTSEGGENELVAYYLLKENTRTPTACELQKHLMGSLPDYMIPATFLRLHAFPVSANGKIDFTVLAHQTEVHAPEERDALSSAVMIEEKLLTLMQDILKDDAVRIEDNFFLAGGHSLLAMQLLMRIRDAFGVELTLRQLFEAPTVGRLAPLVESMLIDAIGSMSDQEAENELRE